ncbi:MAG: glycoside hydrolase family 5 protein [Gemmatimonadetes bacterium]|nr:glycoside hydrolase family 5 protein [Gemmatimonadota bacterium]
MSGSSSSPDAAAVARSLGRGVNFGNILDAPNEGVWGVSLTEDLFDAVRTVGAATIRLPVRWSNHALARSPYTIDAAFFARVDYAVAAARARGLHIVIDMHHHHQLDGDALDPGEFAVDSAVLEERFVAMWQQIATRYRDQPAAVLFEVYNEPHGLLTNDRWNVLLAKTLAVVRAIDPTRYVVVGPGKWNHAGSLASLVLPATDQRLIVTIHNYEPFAFTHQGAAWVGLADSPVVTCCTVAQLAQMTAPLDIAVAWRTSSGRPLWVGEFGSYEKGPYASRVTYSRASRDAMEARGMTWAYWELASGFGIYSHPTGAWKTELRDALFQ